MLPRNLTMFRFSPLVAADLMMLETRLAAHVLRSPGPLEFGTSGFLSPYGPNDDRLVIRVGAFALFHVATEERQLPAAAVNKAVYDKCQKISRDEGRKVGGRERKCIREAVIGDMLPNAWVKQVRTLAWVDTTNGWLVIDTASRKRAELVVTQIREALGSFPAVPLAPEEGPRVLMTDWLTDAMTSPVGFGITDECELRDPATATGAIARFRRQDLAADEVRENLRAGKQVFRLGLYHESGLSFTLGEDLVVRKLKFDEALLDTQYVEADNGHDADAVLATGEVAKLLAAFESIFNVPRPGDSL